MNCQLNKTNVLGIKSVYDETGIKSLFTNETQVARLYTSDFRRLNTYKYNYYLNQFSNSQSFISMIYSGVQSSDNEPRSTTYIYLGIIILRTCIVIELGIGVYLPFRFWSHED